MKRIAVVGSLNMDLVAVARQLPRAGETVIGTRYFTAPGGKGANQAYAAARLGGNVIMLGRIGDDHHGEQMRANLESSGCDTTGIRSVAGPSGVALITVAEDGTNAIVVAPGANALYRASDFADDAACLDQAQYVLLQLESPMQTVIAAARAAKLRGATVILDPAPAQSVLPPELLANVDIFTPNESEAAIVGGRSEKIPLSLAEAQAIGSELQARGVQTIVVKLGARGCLLLHEQDVVHILPPQVQAVDTTAAGDTFNAALAVALSEGASLSEACIFASSAAAVSVTRFGAQSSAPTRAEVDALNGVTSEANRGQISILNMEKPI